MKTQSMKQHANANDLPMKRTFLLLVLCLTIAMSLSVAAFGQEEPKGLQGRFETIPLQGNTPEHALQESQQGLTIPLWSYTFKIGSPLQTYTGQIMGLAYQTNQTTNIPTYVVPLIVQIGSYTFDPTKPAPACASNVVPLTAVQNSPLFQNSGPFIWNGWNFGTTQYIDALQVAEWTPFDTLQSNWHTLFQLHTTGAVTVNVPAGQGTVYNAPCGQLGAVNYLWLDNYVRNTLIPSLSNQGVGPTTFPVILMHNVVEQYGGCCILGYHGAYGSPMQVYSPAMFDTTGAFKNSMDISALSHELGEAVNDPTGVNPTPPWGNIGQVSGCQTNFEVGDPLSGTLYTPITLSGYTYHPQELVMMPWFYHFNTKFGVGWYSTNGTFKGFAKDCPPGGTN